MEKKRTRREVIKAAAYVAPVVLTLTAKPARARGGSVCQKTETITSKR